MKIFVTGTRGIPDIPGGVESHCQQLYPLIASKGYRIKISRRKPYVDDGLREWSGVELVDNFSPRKKSIEAIVHTFIAILEAKKWGADIIHVHAIGPAIMVPFARLLGIKVVMTHHGPDYDREKWGRLAKFVLKIGEKLGGLFANEVIVISEVIRKIIKDRCSRYSHLIYNGVPIPEKIKSTSYLDSLGINPGEYVLAVARFVPEKGLHDLIQAFSKSGLEAQLVIAGDADHQDQYSESLKQSVRENKKIILTGYISGEPLSQLFSHARIFVLPSYHEGLPISLLEALSYGIQPLVSDIPANLEVGLEGKAYFRCKDVANLQDKLISLYAEKQDMNKSKQRIEFVREKYNWSSIADQTIEVYKKLIH